MELQLGLDAPMGKKKYHFNKAQIAEMEKGYNPLIVLEYLRKVQPDILRKEREAKRKRDQLLSSHRTRRNTMLTAAFGYFATLKVTGSHLCSTFGALAAGAMGFFEGYRQQKRLINRHKVLKQRDEESDPTAKECDQALLERLQWLSSSKENIPGTLQAVVNAQLRLCTKAGVLHDLLRDHLQKDKVTKLIISKMQSAHGLFIPDSIADLTTQFSSSLNAY